MDAYDILRLVSLGIKALDKRIKDTRQQIQVSKKNGTWDDSDPKCRELYGKYRGLMAARAIITSQARKKAA